MADSNFQLMAETKEAFDIADEDNDGAISHSQLRACLRSLTGVQKLPDKIICEVLKEADHDDSGSINFEEFCNAIATCSLLETTINLFLKCDVDKSGHITLDELHKYVAELPEASRSQLDIEKVIVECDTDQSGTISFEEFANHLMNEAENGNEHLMGQS